MRSTSKFNRLATEKNTVSCSLGSNATKKSMAR